MWYGFVSRWGTPQVMAIQIGNMLRNQGCLWFRRWWLCNGSQFFRNCSPPSCWRFHDWLADYSEDLQSEAAVIPSISQMLTSWKVKRGQRKVSGNCGLRCITETAGANVSSRAGMDIQVDSWLAAHPKAINGVKSLAMSICPGPHLAVVLLVGYLLWYLWVFFWTRFVAPALFGGIIGPTWYIWQYDGYVWGGNWWSIRGFDQILASPKVSRWISIAISGAGQQRIGRRASSKAQRGTSFWLCLGPCAKGRGMRRCFPENSRWMHCRQQSKLHGWHLFATYFGTFWHIYGHLDPVRKATNLATTKHCEEETEAPRRISLQVHSETQLHACQDLGSRAFLHVWPWLRHGFRTISMTRKLALGLICIRHGGGWWWSLAGIEMPSAAENWASVRVGYTQNGCVILKLRQTKTCISQSWILQMDDWHQIRFRSLL